MRLLTLSLTLVLAACSSGQSEQSLPGSGPDKGKAEPDAQRTSGATESPPPHLGDPPAGPPAPDPTARTVALEQWRKSADPKSCAPLALTSDGGAQGTARRAEFSGGWGVAFDQPGLRSAYGFAGTGFLPEDLDEVAAQRARLAAQWPYFRELAQLPKPSFAGYGIEGAKDYPADKPDGRGENSIAYVRVAGQQCDYNVWSRLGRAHLEHLLEHLELLPTR